MGSQSVISEYVETEHSLTITLKKQSNRYLDEFVRMRCAPDLLVKGLFPNTTEITESMGAYNAVRRHIRHTFKNDKVLIVVVGDGNTPRTGALFAHLTPWDVWSVDPALRDEWCYAPKIKGINRLFGFQDNVEILRFDKLTPHYDYIVFVGLHSHVNIQGVWNKIHNAYGDNLHYVSIPCCEDIPLDGGLVREYHDWGIHSPMRKVMIYRGADYPF